jgi:hypothetical protein
MEADLSGFQRRVFVSRVSPARAAHGDSGIPLKNGRTLPFKVVRQWSAPAGNYEERWYLVHPETREVIYESRPRNLLIWGLQSLTEVVDDVTEPFALTPGEYLIVFSLGGTMGGQLDVEAAEVPAEEAA